MIFNVSLKICAGMTVVGNFKYLYSTVHCQCLYRDEIIPADNANTFMRLSTRLC